MSRIEPVPAGSRIGRIVLLGVSHQQTVRFGHAVHAGAGRKVFGGLAAAMQHHDEATQLIQPDCGDI